MYLTLLAIEESGGWVRTNVTEEEKRGKLT